MKNKTTVIFILSIITFLVGLWLWIGITNDSSISEQQNKNNRQMSENIQDFFSDPVIEVGSDDWTTYTDDKVGFSIRYPSSWFYQVRPISILFTPLAPEDPKRSSSIGIISSLSITSPDKEKISEISQQATHTETVFVGGIEGNLFLTPNLYGGGFNHHYIFLLPSRTYLEMSFYGETNYPFEEIIETFEVL